jgi:hypothetical protein
VGLSDRSGPVNTGRATLRTDGVVRFDQALALGESHDLTTTLLGVGELAFSWAKFDRSGQPTTKSALVALGSPQVLCRD